ncbi:MAG: GlsB/YeaQ/YmgE family stress response membrane protein [Candidatus Pacebacteria bacterium]|nr:GlsB/YeaQ/YmgE family stress response membrane protein [Candidatus Paceibacterota bacterium]
MSILVWIIFGALAGWIASTLMGSSSGLLWDIVLGIVGAGLGGMVMGLFGQAGISGFNLYSIVVAIVGAIILIAIARAFTGNRRIQ